MSDLSHHRLHELVLTELGAEPSRLVARICSRTRPSSTWSTSVTSEQRAPISSRLNESPSTLARSTSRRCGGVKRVEPGRDQGLQTTPAHRRASRSSASGSARTYCPPRGTTRSRSISERTVSTANSGMPSARSTSTCADAVGQPGHQSVEQRRDVPVGQRRRDAPPCRAGSSQGPHAARAGPGRVKEHDEAGEGAGRHQVLDELEQPVVGVLRVVDHQDDRRFAATDALEEGRSMRRKGPRGGSRPATRVRAGRRHAGSARRARHRHRRAAPEPARAGRGRRSRSPAPSPSWKVRSRPRTASASA